MFEPGDPRDNPALGILVAETGEPDRKDVGSTNFDHPAAPIVAYKLQMAPPKVNLCCLCGVCRG